MIILASNGTLAAGASVSSKVTCTLFGMELNGSTETYKVLDQRQLASSPATIYTATANGPTFIRSITVNNNDTSVRTFRLFSGGTADVNAITPTFSLLPNGAAIYEDGLGWQFYNNMGQLLRANGMPDMGDNDNYSLSGFLAESIPRNICTETNTVAPTLTGTLFMQAIYLKAGTLVSNISISSATTAANGPTNYIVGLYSAGRALLATSNNQTNAAWASNTLRTLAMTTPYLVPTTGLYYVGFFMSATSAIITTKGNTAKTGGQLSAAAPILHGATSDTGLTTALPANTGTITGGLVTMWCAVS